MSTGPAVNSTKEIKTSQMWAGDVVAFCLILRVCVAFVGSGAVQLVEVACTDLASSQVRLNPGRGQA